MFIQIKAGVLLRHPLLREVGFDQRVHLLVGKGGSFVEVVAQGGRFASRVQLFFGPLLSLDVGELFYGLAHHLGVDEVLPKDV